MSRAAPAAAFEGCLSQDPGEAHACRGCSRSVRCQERRASACLQAASAAPSLAAHHDGECLCGQDEAVHKGDGAVHRLNAPGRSCAGGTLQVRHPTHASQMSSPPLCMCMLQAHACPVGPRTCIPM